MTDREIIEWLKQYAYKQPHNEFLEKWERILELLSPELYKDVYRVEVIDAKGRTYVKYGVTHTELQLQDDGKTLKIFLTEDKDANANL